MRVIETKYSQAPCYETFLIKVGSTLATCKSESKMYTNKRETPRRRSYKFVISNQLTQALLVVVSFVAECNVK